MAYTLPAMAVPLTTELVASGFTSPVLLTSPKGDIERMFIVEQRTGLIRIIKNGSVLPTPFLNVLPLITNMNERGLLGLAFHPRYATNGYFYINYTDLNGDTRVMRYSVSSDPDVADANSAFEILSVVQPFENHNGGMLAFGPDGYLYIAMGDGGGQPGNRPQELSSDYGKILRIDVDGGSPYAIPPDNPYVGVAGANERVFARGLRNPWRFSFDALTGDLWLADVGANLWEELNFVKANSGGGQNYGWPIAEGFSCFGPPGNCGLNPGFTPPIHVYGRDIGRSITGGYVYRGPITDLQGTYFFADFIRGRIWSLRYDGQNMTEFQERTAELDPPGALDIRAIASFGEDAEHNLYVLDWGNGEVFKIVAAPGLPAQHRGGLMLLAMLLSLGGCAYTVARKKKHLGS